MMVLDEHRMFHPAPRKSLLDMLGGSSDQEHNPRIVITQTQEPGVPESTTTSPLSPSPSKHVLPRPESRTSSIARQLSVAVDVPRTDPALPQTPVALEIHTREPQDSDMMIDLYADPGSSHRSPFSFFSDLSEVVRESAELDRIANLHQILTAEREELLRRHEEATRALSRTKSQLDRVLSLTDEATQMTSVFVDKEKSRLETKKTKIEAKIEHGKNIEAEKRRKAKESERIRQQEEERNAQLEMEQAERRRLEEQRKKEEALAAERQRLEEIQARERAQAEERRRVEEEQQRLAEEDRKRRDEEQRKEEEERLRKRLSEEKEAMARKQEEERRVQLLGRKRKEAEAAAAAKAEAERQAEQQRLFQERRANVQREKFKNHGRPESGNPSTGPSSTPEGTASSNPPSILINDVSRNPQVITEQSSAIAQANRARDTPTFVPAVTEAGRLPPDLSQRIRGSHNGTDHEVKHEATSPVITPVDDAEPVESAPPTPLPSRPVSSMSTTAPAPTPQTLAVPPPHLLARPPTIYSQPPRPRDRHSGPRSPPRSRGSPTPSLSPEPTRGRYPPSRNVDPYGDHYSPPRDHYRNGSSRYDRDSPSLTPPPRNARKRTAPDPWDRADTPSKLDYSHGAKRTRGASPLRSRSPPSPRGRPLTQPPPVVSARRPPPPNRRGRPVGQLPLEQRLSTGRPELRERIQ